jgi:Protein of unknown function (DUF3024)
MLGEVVAEVGPTVGERPERIPAVATLPELDVAAVRVWCDARVPAHARHQVWLDCEVTDRHLTIVERRLPYWADHPARAANPEQIEWTRHPIARLLYTRSRREWTLHWRDRNMRFHRHARAPAPTVADLLTAIDNDRTGIFFG